MVRGGLIVASTHSGQHSHIKDLPTSFYILPSLSGTEGFKESELKATSHISKSQAFIYTLKNLDIPAAITGEGTISPQNT